MIGRAPLIYSSALPIVPVPLETIVKSQFVTARAAARQMKKQRSGVIVFLTGSPARGHIEGGTAIGTAFGAIESLMENLALELGPSGVRVICLRTTANTDSRTIQQTMDVMASQMGASKDDMITRIASFNFLKTPARVADTAKAVVFLASDRARMMTGTELNCRSSSRLPLRSFRRAGGSSYELQPFIWEPPTDIFG